uniref:Uncharacterized protein n=1 Tax=uncultured Nitrospirae bacterium MY4-5C TaxID=798580 RepID=D9MP70_9BACT|nr:hypothetical protein LW5_0010 [uncultured Nitrospirae bacterium MY4-5C]
MLTVLEEGVKGGKWFSLMDKVYSNLSAAWEKLKGMNYRLSDTTVMVRKGNAR